MAKVSDWEIPRKFGLGNELARWRVKGYSLVGPEMERQEFSLEVTAFSENQAEMRFRYLFGDGIHKVTEITKIGDVAPGAMADGEVGRERAGRMVKEG
ncbi:MAG TPA: hypothetical protein VEI97_00710 [bacterium]|nr:hypothetical protein [bacterium]